MIPLRRRHLEGLFILVVTGIRLVAYCFYSYVAAKNF